MKPTHVLVIEPSPLKRRRFGRALRSHGFEVREAIDGKAALDRLAAYVPALVVLDEKYGFELLSKVRERVGVPRLPAILILSKSPRVGGGGPNCPPEIHVLVEPVRPPVLCEVAHDILEPMEVCARGERVLVVSADETTRSHVRFLLGQAGFRAETVPNGRVAMTEARSRPPAAILSDILAPGVDGLELCRQARNDPRLLRVPIVIVSSVNVEEQDIELSRLVGANRIVARSEGLREAVRAVASVMGAPALPLPTITSGDLAMRLQARVRAQVERRRPAAGE